MPDEKKKNPFSPVITSSEIAQYIFCPVSWWFDRTEGKTITKEMKLGTDFHVKHAVKQNIAYSLNTIKKVIIFLIIIFILISIFRWLK